MKPAMSLWRAQVGQLMPADPAKGRTKQCANCFQTKLETEFHLKPSRNNTRRANCIQCAREIDMERYRAKKGAA